MSSLNQVPPQMKIGSFLGGLALSQAAFFYTGYKYLPRTDEEQAKMNASLPAKERVELKVAERFRYTLSSNCTEETLRSTQFLLGFAEAGSAMIGTFGTIWSLSTYDRPCVNQHGFADECSDINWWNVACGAALLCGRLVLGKINQTLMPVFKQKINGRIEGLVQQYLQSEAGKKEIATELAAIEDSANRQRLRDEYYARFNKEVIQPLYASTTSDQLKFQSMDLAREIEPKFKELKAQFDNTVRHPDLAEQQAPAKKGKQARKVEPVAARRPVTRSQTQKAK